MDWTRIFRLYNLRMLKSHALLYVFVMFSIGVAVSISVSIPQIVVETGRAMTGQVAKLNGADLQIIADYESNSFQEKLTELEQNGVTVRRSHVFSISFKNGSNQVFGDMIVGDYGLEANEIILYSGLAAELNVKENDSLSIGGRTYIIKALEPMALAVDGQSEMVGYGKVSSYDSLNQTPFTSIILIDSDQSEALKDELKTIEPGYKYSTIHDKEKEIENRLNTNAGTLNILNTLSYMMTILSVLSSIFMIIVQRQKDIAMIRLLSIRMKSIKRALRAELYLMLLTPVLIGGAASIPLAKRLLLAHGIAYGPFDSELFRIVGLGTLLFLFIYAVFINVATMSVEAIHPLFVIRNDTVSWGRSKRKITWLSAGFTLMTLLGYTVYLGRGSALITSLIMIFFIALYFGITMICIKVGTRFPYKRKLFMYSSKHVHANRYSYVIIILSLALTVLFMLMGYTLETTVRDSFNKGTEQKLQFNYLAVSSDTAGLEKAIKQTKDVRGYTKLYVTSGTLSYSQGSRRSVQLCELNPNEYQVKYNVLEGEDVFTGSDQDVLISSEFRDKVHLNLGDHLKLEVDGEPREMRIKGIYESGMLNQSYILKPAEGEAKGRVMFLLQADSAHFKDGMENVMTLHVGIMGMHLAKMISDFLSIFKWLCIICILSSVLFNLNLVYMGCIQEWKETVIIRALGVGKGFLYRYTALKAAITLVLSLLLSLGLYLLLVYLALSVLMHMDVNVVFRTILLPIVCAVWLVTVIYMLPVKLIWQSQGYAELREQV